MPESPAFNSRTVLKPSFKSESFNFKAGTAFVVNFEEQYLLLTAHHLFGSEGGLKKPYTGEELRNSKVSVSAKSFDTDELVLASGNNIAIKGAQAYKSGGTANDLAVFSVAESKALVLAKKMPQIGDAVFMACHLKPKKMGQPTLHSAKVVAVTHDYIEYKFDSKMSKSNAISGAPVLNTAGEVVGMNLSSTGIPGISLKGRANTALNIRQRLRTALQLS